MKDGDAITVVDGIKLVLARVLGPTFRDPTTGRQTFRWYGAGYAGWTSDDEEGQRWIRGHLDDDTTEARALLVARALS